MILLRPWFLLMAAILLVFWIFKKHLKAHNPLENFVDKRLLPFLTVHFNINLYRLKMRWFVFFWLILTIAGAGPAFEKINVPAITQAPAVVIVMDLSPAMTQDNLTKAKLKLYDLLKALKGKQVGLVLYDEKGYSASPITQDIEVIQNMIPALSANVMPRPLNRPVTGFVKATELLKNAGIKKGQIIFITAGGFDATGLKEASLASAHPITTLAIETDEAGYPVPSIGGDFMRHSDGTLLLVKPDKETLSEIGSYVPMTVSDSDIRQIINSIPTHSSDSDKTPTNTAVIWKDLGPYLLFLAIGFFIWVFRKGVFFTILILLPLGAHAGLFERADQEIYRKTMAGVNAYRIGNYEAARQVFEVGKTANDFYNAGNAKAHLNDIQGAIKAYEAALKINPNHSEAKFNKEYLQRQMPPQQNSQNDAQNQEQQNNQNPSSPSDTQSNSQQNESETSSDNTSDAQNNSQNSQEQNASSDRRLQEQQTDTQQQNTADKQAKPDEHQSDKGQPVAQEQFPTEPATEKNSETQSDNLKQFDQESEQLLNKIKQDPSRLLRYRLLQQYMRSAQ